MPGFPHIRKAACMFGWDWGPRLPDAGLFRPVSLMGCTCARISQVLIRQVHHVAAKTVQGNQVDRVDLAADCEVEWLPEAGETPLEAAFVLTAPDGTRMHAVSEPVSIGVRTAQSENLTGLRTPLRTDHLQLHLAVENPQLWWPNEYGEQPLYRAEVQLRPVGKDTALDTWTRRIGLRTVTVNTDPLPEEQRDPHMTGQRPDYDDGKLMFSPDGGDMTARVSREGKKIQPRNFAITVNGLAIFAMGADYIPEDSILTRQSRERTDLLLSSAKEAHHNCMRIWGGGYFCDDAVYDLCDEKGILVWQDMMFSCAAYELDAAFEKNISLEIRQNIRRLRSHPCLALWCGNNEMETQYETWDWPKTKKQYYDYIRLFECLIPDMVRQEDPDAFYWPSSPSSGGNFENSNAENEGDTHYWGVWHGNEPFTAYRGHHYRFLSEFGFQSFPAVQTIRRFTLPEDRNIFSRIMEMHQRSTSGNGKMMNYMSQTYQMPKNFDELIYCSQLLQADAIRYGVEHFRRFRGTSMGTVVWQLNDIWPVASWASMDYFYRWKALQYAEKRFFAPVLISCEERGLPDQMPYPNMQPRPVEFSALLHVANETPCEVSGTVEWQLADDASSVLKEGSARVTVPAFGGTWLEKLDFTDLPGFDPLRHHLTYVFRMAPADVRAVEAVTGTPLCQKIADAQGFAGEAAVQNVRSAEAAALADMPKKMTEHGGCTAAETVSGAAGDIVVSRGCSMFAAPKHYEFRDPELAISVHTAGEGESVSTVTVQADAFAKSVAVESPDGDLLLDDNYFDMEKGTAVLTIVGRDGKPLPPDQIPAGPYRARSVYGTICG